MDVFIKKKGVDTEIFNPRMFQHRGYVLRVAWTSDILSPLYFTKDEVIIDDEHIILYKLNEVVATISITDVKSGKVKIFSENYSGYVTTDITIYDDTEED